MKKHEEATGQAAEVKSTNGDSEEGADPAEETFDRWSAWQERVLPMEADGETPSPEDAKASYADEEAVVELVRSGKIVMTRALEIT